MKLHANARTTPHARRLMVRRVLEQAKPVKDVAVAHGVSTRTVHKWVRRYRLDGAAGLHDRSSRPHRTPRRTSRSQRRRIVRLRRQRLTAEEISQLEAVARSTVSRILAREGLGQPKALDPRPPVVRYERSTPGALLHLDTKKLARIVRPGHRIYGDRSKSVEGAGWEFAHVAVDDHSRVAYAEVLEAENQHTCTAFLARAAEFFATRGVSIRRVMTDNGSGYRSKRFNRMCDKLGARHLYTRPYTPRTNGKAERFIRTLTERWAYGCAYPNSASRTQALEPWLNYYNRYRPHAGIGRTPPLSRLEGASA